MENTIGKKYAGVDYKLISMTPKHSHMGSSNYLNIINSSTDSRCRRPSKTPMKTPLRLSSIKKKTPSTLYTNDRYIPNRKSAQIEIGYHLLVSNKDQENMVKSAEGSSIDSIKRRLIDELSLGPKCNEKSKVLSLHSKQPAESLGEGLKNLYSANVTNSVRKKTAIRHLQTTPERVLDAPDFIDDFYLNLIDWSSANNLAVALNKDLYIWNATNKDISQLFSMDEASNEYICSASWIQRGDVLAIGNSKNLIELWDVNKQVCLRQMKSHNSRVGSLAWNMHLLSSGSRSGEIHNHDVRIAQHHVNTIKEHTQEVCSLKWSLDGRYLASGANDNLVAIHELNNPTQALHVLREHTAAVKAMAWCPWQSNVLATGGGMNDRQIKIWNVYNGQLTHSQDAQSQVSSLLWSRNFKELISSHGAQHNQLSVWRFADMSKVGDLVGHANRVLGMTMSPDEETVASVGADETLRFWKCFAADHNSKKAKETSIVQTNLSRCIR